MLGQEMDLVMTGKTYTASKSMDDLKKETFAKFEEHNIVKAMVWCLKENFGMILLRRK
jgi:hypothetical protein